MAEMIRLQKEQLELVQRQAQANEAKLELSSMGMGMGSTMLSAPSYAAPEQQYLDEGHIEDVEELTQQQQERLTRCINNLTGAKLKSALRVIMKDCGLDDDEEAHQLQLDELPKRTQQKLFDMLIRNKGGVPKKAGGATIGRPKQQTNGGYGMNPMGMGGGEYGMQAAQPDMGVTAQEADEAQVLEFNEFDSSTLENDIVLTGNGNLDLGTETNTSNTMAAVASDDWAQARSAAAHASALQNEDQRREEQLKAEMANNSASLQQQSVAAQQAHQQQQKEEAERQRLEAEERQKREQAESAAAREAMRREREQVEQESSMMVDNPDALVRQESGGFSPISLGAGSASPSGSDYGF